MDRSVEEKKKKLAYFWAIVTIIVCFIVGVGVLTQSSYVLPVVVTGVAICFGPICGVLYLLEIRKGVLADTDDEEKTA